MMGQAFRVGLKGLQRMIFIVNHKKLNDSYPNNIIPYRELHLYTLNITITQRVSMNGKCRRYIPLHSDVASSFYSLYLYTKTKSYHLLYPLPNVSIFYSISACKQKSLSVTFHYFIILTLFIYYSFIILFL